MSQWVGDKPRYRAVFTAKNKNGTLEKVKNVWMNEWINDIIMMTSLSTRSCPYQSTEFKKKFLKDFLDPILGQNESNYVCFMFQTGKKYFFHNFIAFPYMT